MNNNAIHILRTKLKNADDKVKNIVLSEGQPFFNISTNKLYVGDGIKKISQLNYVGEEVDNQLSSRISAEVTRAQAKESDLQTQIDKEKKAREDFDNSHNNIENSSSKGSLKQIKDSDFTLSNPNSDKNGQTIISDSTGQFATALGGKSRAEGERAVSAGTQTIAQGNYSAAFGNNSISEGANSFVSGMQNIARGVAAYSEGSNNLSNANSTHTEGIGNKAYGEGSHIEGYGNVESQTGNQNNHIEGSNNTTYASTKMAHIEGGDNKAGYNFAHAEGRYTDANGDYTHTEGIYSKSLRAIPADSGSTGSGSGSGTSGSGSAGSGETFDLNANAGSCVHAEGDRTIGIGYGSHVEGYSTQAEGHFSHTEGVKTKTVGFNSTGAHAEGYENTTQGKGSHVGGVSNTITSGEGSFVHGSNNSLMGIDCAVFGKSNTVTSGAQGFVAGSNNTITGTSGAIGQNNTVTKAGSWLLGQGLKSVGNGSSWGQTVVGRFSNPTDSATVMPAFVVGAGKGDTERLNALVVNASGQVTLANDLIVGNIIYIKNANKNMLEIGSDATSSYIKIKDKDNAANSGLGTSLTIGPSYLKYNTGVMSSKLDLPWRQGGGTLALDEYQIYKTKYSTLVSSDDLNNKTISGTYYWSGDISKSPKSGPKLASYTLIVEHLENLYSNDYVRQIALPNVQSEIDTIWIRLGTKKTDNTFDWSAWNTSVTSAEVKNEINRYGITDTSMARIIGTASGIIGMAAAVGLKQVSSDSSNSVTLTLHPKEAISMHKYSPGYSNGTVHIKVPDGWSCSTSDGDTESRLFMLSGDFTVISSASGSMVSSTYEYIIGNSNQSIRLYGSSSANLSLTVYRPNEWYYNIVNAVGFNKLSVTIPSSVTLSEKTITFDVYKHGNLVWCYKDFGTQLMFQDNWDLQLPEDWRPKTTAYGIRITDTVGSSNFGSTFEIPSSGKISTFGQANHWLRYISMVYQIN